MTFDKTDCYQLADIVAEEFCITVDELFSRPKPEELMSARRVLYFLLTVHSRLTKTEVARFLNRDRASIDSTVAAYMRQRQSDRTKIEDEIRILERFFTWRRDRFGVATAAEAAA